MFLPDCPDARSSPRFRRLPASMNRRCAALAPKARLHWSRAARAPRRPQLTGPVLDRMPRSFACAFTNAFNLWCSLSSFGSHRAGARGGRRRSTRAGRKLWTVHATLGIHALAAGPGGPASCVRGGGLERLSKKTLLATLMGRDKIEVWGVSYWTEQEPRPTGQAINIYPILGFVWLRAGGPRPDHHPAPIPVHATWSIPLPPRRDRAPVLGSLPARRARLLQAHPNLRHSPGSPLQPNLFKGVRTRYTTALLSTVRGDAHSGYDQRTPS
jgi:hypothetical protein